MGTKFSKRKDKDDPTIANFLYELAPSDCVHHYMPPHLPMKPILTNVYLKDCITTWKLIVSGNTTKMKLQAKPGICLFYEEFFYRLFQRDYTFEGAFPNIKKRTEVLIMAVSFVLKSYDMDHDQIIDRCRHLGRRHLHFKSVRPHHFAQYVSTIIEVIMYWLGDLATEDSAAAWSNCFGFVLKYMMQAFLHEKIDPYESYQNTVIGAIKIISESSSGSSKASDDVLKRIKDEYNSSPNDHARKLEIAAGIDEPEHLKMASPPMRLTDDKQFFPVSV